MEVRRFFLRKSQDGCDILLRFPKKSSGSRLTSIFSTAATRPTRGCISPPLHGESARGEGLPLSLLIFSTKIKDRPMGGLLFWQPRQSCSYSTMKRPATTPMNRILRRFVTLSGSSLRYNRKQRNSTKAGGNFSPAFVLFLFSLESDSIVRVSSEER